MMKNRGIFLSYIRDNLKNIILTATFLIILITIFILYSLPAEPLFYSLLLCFFAIIIYVLIDYMKYYKTRKSLIDLSSNMRVTVEKLPKPDNNIDRDFVSIINKIYDEKTRVISDYTIYKNELYDYYSMWAHQIKTPISAMKLILQEREDRQGKELQAELFKIEQYVEMVLQYLRVENISSDLMLKYYDLDNIIKHAVKKLSGIFIMKKISLNYQPVSCRILTDEKWLSFVIEQILSNALKYTNKGSISIYMHENIPQVLVIEDTGIGIREEDLPRLFEKGFTGFNGRLDKKSTGIGLYLCRKILKRLSHKISLQSEIGKGTKVMIHLATVQEIKE